MAYQLMWQCADYCQFSLLMTLERSDAQVNSSHNIVILSEIINLLNSMGTNSVPKLVKII